jgi:hypothetical protein
MFRNLLVALASFGAALAASACSYGSAVDIAPVSARVSTPPAAPGDYCEVQGKAAPFSIVSHEECVPVTWDAGTRTYTMTDPDKKPGEKPGEKNEDVEAAIVSLGGGLYIASVDKPDAKGDRYQLHLLLSKGNAFALLPALDDGPLKTLAARHRKLTFADDGAGRPYVVAGRPTDIKHFLKDAAKESLRGMKAENDEISVGIRDVAGASDHQANKQQAKDIEAVLNAAKAMTPK